MVLRLQCIDASLRGTDSHGSASVEPNDCLARSAFLSPKVALDAPGALPHFGRQMQRNGFAWATICAWSAVRGVRSRLHRPCAWKEHGVFVFAADGFADGPMGVSNELKTRTH